MKRSTDRILSTHVGSLVRPPGILEAILKKATNRPYDVEAFEKMVSEGVKDVVNRQALAGIDIPSDGEYSKPSFAGYINERIGGLESVPVEPSSRSTGPMNYPILNEEFPGFMSQYNGMYRTMWMPPEVDRELVDDAISRPQTERTVLNGPIHYKGQSQLQRDIDNFKSAMQGLPFEEAFIPAATPPGSAPEERLKTGIYRSEEEYLQALADAMREEYKAIVDAGFIVQLDLGLPARNQVLPGKPARPGKTLRQASEMQVEAYNYALQGHP